MNKNLIFFIFITFNILLLFIGQNTFAQCNDSLVNIAMSESGSDALFLKEFKVKLEKGNPAKPAPVAKFSAFLKAGESYRFNVVDACEYEGNVVLQLFKKGKMLGSTLDLDSRINLRKFDFNCENSATYQVLMSYMDGKSGCSAGILSMIMKDTADLYENFPQILEQNQILYIGIENELNITSDCNNCRFETSIDNGTISGEKGKFSVRVFEEGKAKISVKVFASKDSISETSITEFEVKKLPVPTVIIADLYGGLVDKNILLSAKKIELVFPESIPEAAYEIIGFSVSDSFTGNSEKSSYNAEFTASQRKFISDLKPGNNLYFRNITVRTLTGEILNVKPLGFILQ